MDAKIIQLIAGLLVPAFGSVVFNSLNHLIEKGRDAAIPPTVFDFAIGCTFTIVGIAASSKKPGHVVGLFIAFVLLLLYLMTLNIILELEFRCVGRRRGGHMANLRGGNVCTA